MIATANRTTEVENREDNRLYTVPRRNLEGRTIFVKRYWKQLSDAECASQIEADQCA